MSVSGRQHTLGFTKPDGRLERVLPNVLAAALGGCAAGTAHMLHIHYTRTACALHAQCACAACIVRIAPHAGSLQLAFLNGCETLELGKAALKAGVKHVICWSTPVVDRAAAKFSESFFERYARHRIACRPSPFRSVGEPLTLPPMGRRFDLAQGNFRAAFDYAKVTLLMSTNDDGDAWVLEDPHKNERAIGVPLLLPEDM